MKHLSIFLLGVITFFFIACESENSEAEQSLAKNAKTVELKSTATQPDYNFPNVPEELVERARKTYAAADLSLPAVTIAFSYTRGEKDIELEEGWHYTFWNTPVQDCYVGEGSKYEEQGSLKTIDGFTFLEEEDLCGYGVYGIDNRQGGWFDYVCGPHDISFEYNGKEVFVYVRLWCE